MNRIIFATIFTFLFGLLILSTILFPSNNDNSVFLENNLDKKTGILNHENLTQHLQPLTYCELVNNPQQYDGKIIRLSAKLLIGLEGSWFYDSKCGMDNAAIASSENEEVDVKIMQARKQKNSEFWINEVDLTVLGKFKNIAYKDCCLIAPFQFEILKVEKTSKDN